MFGFNPRLEIIGHDKAYGSDRFNLLINPDGTLTILPHQHRQDSQEKFIMWFESERKKIVANRKGSLLWNIYCGPHEKAQHHKHKMMQALHRGDISYLEYRRLRMKTKSFIQRLTEDLQYKDKGDTIWSMKKMKSLLSG